MAGGFFSICDVSCALMNLSFSGFTFIPLFSAFILSNFSDVLDNTSLYLFY